MAENFLFSYSRWNIIGINSSGQELVSFLYNLFNDEVSIYFKNLLMGFEYSMSFDKNEFNEQNVKEYIDHILRSNAANVEAESLILN